MSEFFNPYVCGWMALGVGIMLNNTPWYIRYPWIFFAFFVGQIISDHLSLVIPR